MKEVRIPKARSLIHTINNVLWGRKTAVAFEDSRFRVRATRRGRNEVVLTIGRPNYREREFLKLCRKAKTKPRKLWFPK